MKHERGMKELLGQNGTSGGESGQQTSFYAGQSVYGNYTSLKGGRKETKKERGRKVKCFVSTFQSFFCIYCHLSSVIPPRLTEILIEGEGH